LSFGLLERALTLMPERECCVWRDWYSPWQYPHPLFAHELLQDLFFVGLLIPGQNQA